MQFIITGAGLTRSRAVNVPFWAVAAVGAALVAMVFFAGLWSQQWFFSRSSVVGAVPAGLFDAGVASAQHDGAQEREQYLRANLDAMARRVGEMQARLVQLESLSERVMGLAGVPAAELPASGGGRGGALVAARDVSHDELAAMLGDLELSTHQHFDIMTVLESRLFDEHIRHKMVPTHAPVTGRTAGSAFGWRLDPLTGQSALHTGLDFAARTGTPIYAAAGGVVLTQEFHPAYGNMVEIEHGNRLVTRYAHASRTLVKRGDLVRRGQKIAEIGTTGRSTGPHLHFEVLVQGVFQDPQKFLNAGGTTLLAMEQRPKPVSAQGSVAAAAERR